VPVVETDQVRRGARRAVHLDDLAGPVRMADGIAVHMKLVTDRCVHHSTSSCPFAPDAARRIR
jgi:hypothetical protein